MTQTTTDLDASVAQASSRGGGEPMIQCAGLTKTFRDFWLRNRVRAVDSLDLLVRRGEVYGLLGPNGSGKSTTIKMILGLLHPTAGRVAVFGKRPDDVATKKRIGYLPEESYLYRFLTARETLDYYGRLFHQDRRQRQKRIDMLLEMVGLEAMQRRPVGEFSKGMQRRIGLAQALINDPQLLILDEPTAGLDPIGTRQFKDLILELGRRGKTVLLCSHLLADVEDVCDRLSIMFGGRIRIEGTVDELLTREDLTMIETGSLDESVVAEIERVLEQHGSHVQRVDRPRQKLESLFLEIVHRAQAEGAMTSGAVAGGQIAAFLMDDAFDQEADVAAEQRGQAEASELLDRLTQPTVDEAASSTSATPVDAAAASISRDGEAGGAGEAARVVDGLVSGQTVPETRTPETRPHDDEASAGEKAANESSANTPSRAEPAQDVDRDLLNRLTRNAREPRADEGRAKGSKE